MSRLLIFSLALLGCAALPLSAATFTVNNPADAVDATPGNGVCETVSGSGICTLRAAVQEAGHLPGVHTIVVPAGKYTLSASPACSYKLVGNPAVLTENMSALCVTGNVTITGAGSGVTIIDAGGSGGATTARGFLISLDAVASLSGVTIQNGFSAGSLTVFGGSGINNQGKLTLSDIVFTANRTSVSGGGISNNGILAVDNALFNANTADTGAGLYNNTGATATITNTTFNNGVAINHGAAIFNIGTVAMSGSALVNNAAGFNGGAIYSENASMSLTNVTISGNTAVNAAGIFNYQLATLTANNVTIAFNHATGNSGGFLNAGSFTMRNSIVAGNIADQGAPDCFAGPASAVSSRGHNLVSNTTNCSITGSTATDVYNVSAGLAALAPNGGATPTHALLTGSPAIDAGAPAAPGSGGASCAAIDQRGYFRPQGAKCDIGAFERSSTFALSGVLPLHAANTSVTEAFISGSALASGATAKLRRGGQSDIVGSSVSVQDGNAAMAASFDLTGKAAGIWDLVVTNPDGSVATLPGAFTVDPTGSTQVWVEVAGPAIVRPGSSPTYSVVYGNRGNMDALAVPITFSTPASTPLHLQFAVTPPPAQAGQVAIDWTHAPLYVSPDPSKGQVNVPLLLPVIPAGFSGVLSLTLKVPSTVQEGQILAFQTPAGDPYFNPGLSASTLGAMVTGAVGYAQANLAVSVPSSATPALNQYATNQLLVAVANGRAALTNSFGTAPLVYSLGQFSIDLAEYAATLGSPGASSLAQRAVGSEDAMILVPGGFTLSPRLSGGAPASGKCNGQVMIGHSSCNSGGEDVPPPGDDKKPFTPADCRSIGGHHVSADGTTCVPDRTDCPAMQDANYTDPFCLKIPFRSSADPNAKWGPVGSGAQHFRPAGGPFNYDVEFENLATASLAAQQVVVTDQLDTSTLDITTFSLGPISFGPYAVTPPPGLKHYTSGIDLRPATNVQVKIDAALNQTTGLVTWRFTSLDPATGEATTDPTAGFLPPDITPPQGQAHLLYSISPRSSLPDGTTVCNKATVVFDTNPAINTQNWCNTLDFTNPVSHVQPLPASEVTTSFTVQWTGSDAGSGISDFTIYVSDNGGAYSAWINNTTLTQSTYTGVNGHTYRFYSIARDVAGNVEGTKTAAEATTVVNTGGGCSSDVSSQFTITRSGFRLNNATKRFQQTVTLTRTAAGALAGPFVFAIENLSANATLYNPAGTTTCIAPGSAYLTVNPGNSWTQGQVLTLALEFVNPSNAGIIYTPALLAGATR